MFNEAKVIVCVGTGGVGKTTVSAGLGVLAAQQGLKVLVLTIDPAKRLAQALGLKADDSGEVRVPHQDFAGELSAGLIDAHAAFEHFIRENSSDKEKAERLIKNRLYHQLSTSLSGSQEFTSLDHLYRAVESNKYDLIILDTPPAQNAKDFFSAPERIFSLFQKSITRWFMQGSESKSLFTRVINRGTQTVLGALEKLTGSEFIGALAEFFVCVEGVQEKISQRSIDVHQLLVSSQTKFLLVTSYNGIKLKEGQRLLSDLKRLGYPLSNVVVNRCYPSWVEKEPLEPTGSSQIDELIQQMKHYYDELGQKYNIFEKELANHVNVIKVPEMESDVTGLSELKQMASLLESRLGG